MVKERGFIMVKKTFSKDLQDKLDYDKYAVRSSSYSDGPPWRIMIMKKSRILGIFPREKEIARTMDNKTWYTCDRELYDYLDGCLKLDVSLTN
jgi:hypothetical protein